MRYHFDLPLKTEDIQKLKLGDIFYVSGLLFTARDKAHKKMKNLKKLPFEIENKAIFHCGPIMKKKGKSWIAVSAGPTTSYRMEEFEDKIVNKFKINLIIGKGGMGDKTKKSLKKNKAIYASFTGGAGALAANKIKSVEDVFWLKELGMPEAVWKLKVKDFGPLVVSIDSNGNSIYK